jgi:hypothetical protein
MLTEICSRRLNWPATSVVIGRFDRIIYCDILRLSMVEMENPNRITWTATHCRGESDEVLRDCYANFFVGRT